MKEIDSKNRGLLINAGAEGIILLKNENNLLPLKEKDIVSVFGRCQLDYFNCGFGSGGEINTPYKVNLIEGLKNNNIKFNKELVNIYKKWHLKKCNIARKGTWGFFPQNYKEMKLTEDIVSKCKENSNIAIYVIGRNAGECQDVKLKKSSYYLTDIEIFNLELIKKHFVNIVLILNINASIDFKEINRIGFDSIILAHGGGMESGNSLAGILSGNITPSGKLTDTLVESYDDSITKDNFYGKNYNYYTEDIFVGYRNYVTFNSDKILYPFGYGLSYTTFKKEILSTKANKYKFSFLISVENIGAYKGKEVVEIYLKAPKGKLSKPEYILVGFEKTDTLNMNEKTTVNIDIDLEDFGSYDEESLAYVLEKGVYEFYIGSSCLDLENIYSFKYDNDHKYRSTKSLFYVRNTFKRVSNSNKTIKYEDVYKIKYNLKERVLKNIKEPLKINPYDGSKFEDVKNGKIDLDYFISMLSPLELCDLSSGEGFMNSKLGEKGNGGAFGGITEDLRNKGIPPVIVCDGPSGIRVKAKSSQVPTANAIASTWNKNIAYEIGEFLGYEAKERNIDILLGPGLNIHRNELCGRNFEYLSEDPLISGVLAGNIVKGIESTGVLSTPKHYLANHQERNRRHNDSRVSTKALREIYLRNFEYMYKIGNPSTIMTSYNMINGVYGHNNYDSTVGYMREELGYKGMFMTDWWIQYVSSKEFKKISGNAYRVRSGVNLLMPGDMVDKLSLKHPGKNLYKSYISKEGITLYELQNNARYILSTVLKSTAMDRNKNKVNSDKIVVDNN